MTEKRINVGVLLGDPSGIGPELISKLLAEKITDKVNIVVIGEKNILNKLALTASNLYANNLLNFVNNLYDNKKKDISINKEDEIISKTLINKEL